MYPNLGVAWCWAALVGRGRRLLLVRDQDLDAPRGAALEVRGQSLWSAVTCETPLEHWSVGLEAFAVAFDDPLEAVRSERGDLVGLGLDLEWEATGPAFGPGPGGYQQACRVSGEILVADEQLDFDGTGFRHHRWGVQDWWRAPGRQASWTLEDGTACWLSQADATPASERPGTLSVSTEPDGTITGARATSGSISVDAVAVAPAPVLVEAPDGRRSQLATALSHFRADDGRQGAGWVARLWPQAGWGPRFEAGL